MWVLQMTERNLDYGECFKGRSAVIHTHFRKITQAAIREQTTPEEAMNGDKED